MKKIKERTYTKRLLSFIIGLFIGWIFYILVFSMTLEQGQEISNTQGIISGILSLITIIIYEIIGDYNYLKKLELITASLYSNINVYKERENNLLSKAEKIISKFIHHESDTQKSIASLRSGNVVGTTNTKESMSLGDLKVTVENYPDLKSDKHISMILNQLEESQNTILNSKLLYNEYVTYYNSGIISFPVTLLSELWKLKPLQLYVDNDINEFLK